MSEALDRLKVAEDALADVRRLLEAGRSSEQNGEKLQDIPPVDPGRSSGLRDPAAFFKAMRASKALGPVLSSDEVSGCEAIMAACTGFPIAWTAYCLATAAHETAFTMQPIKELGGQAYFRRLYDIQGERPAKARELGNLTPGDGAKYAGRGYVQLTGRTNYARAEAELGVPLVSDPDLAMQPAIAAKIMREGMRGGWFTGKKLETYLPAEASAEQFRNARRIINGLDKAEAIAGYAMEFQAALRSGGWAL